MLVQSLKKFSEDTGLLARKKQQVAPVHVALELTSNGKFLRFTKLGGTDRKGNPLRAQMWVPQRTNRTMNIEPEYIVDKAEYVLGLGEKGDKQFAAYRTLIAEAAASTGDPSLKAYLNFLSSPDVAEAKEAYEGVKGVGNIVVKVGDNYLHELHDVMEFWRNRDNDCSEGIAFCAICGLERPPVRIHPKVSGGGFGASLISFNSDVTNSYGHKGGETFPVCAECAEAYSIALQRLLKEDFPDPVTCEPMPRTSLSLSDNKKLKKVALYWEVASTKGESRTLDLRSIFEKADMSAIPERDDNDQSWFHYVILSQLSRGRLTVEDYTQASFSDILDRLRTFYDQLQIDNLPETEKNPYTPWWYKYMLIGKTKAKLPPSFVSDLFACAMNPNRKFPAWMYARTLNRVRMRGVYPATVSLIKAILIRNYIEPRRKKGDIVPDLKKGLEPDCPNVAYQFGRYFATVEYVHRRAINSNQSLSDTMYVSAATRPRTVQVKLRQKLNLCIKKMPQLKGYLKTADEALQFITPSNPLPALLTPEQQGWFTMGYAHQRAEFYKPKPEAKAEETAA